MTTIEARYRDASLPIEQRVADLLARMTLAEKVAQLGSVWSFELFKSESELDEARIRERLATGMGQISRVAGATNLDPAGAAEAGNAIQRYLVEETRLGIPAILHEETLHGVLARGATSFQQSIGAAAAFDPELVEAIATTIRRRMLAIGGRLALAPVLDTTRDPRWGRVEETYGEDPYLADRARRRLRPRDAGRRRRHGGRRDRQAPRRPRARRGRAQPGAGPPRAARDARRAAAAVRGRRPRRRAREHDAGLLRRRRAPVPRLARAADVDPARRVGLRRDRRLGLHGGPDARRRAPADRRPGHRRLDGAARGPRQRAADVGRVRGDRWSRRSRTGGSTSRSSTSRSSATCGSSSASGCSSGPTSTRRPPRCSTSSTRRSTRSPPGSCASRSCCSRTTACCRSPRTAGGSRSSARSRTAPGTSWATTRTCPTSRRSRSSATRRTRSASRRAT